MQIHSRVKPGKLNNGLMSHPFSRTNLINSATDTRFFLHFADGLGSQYGIDDLLALHFQHTWSLEFHPLNPNNHFNQGQSPLHWKRPARTFIGPLFFLEESEGSQLLPSWRFDGFIPVYKPIRSQLNISNMASREHLPPQPQSQMSSLDMQVNKFLSELPQLQIFHDMTYIEDRCWIGTPSPCIPIGAKGTLSGTRCSLSHLAFLFASPLPTGKSRISLKPPPIASII